MTKPSSNIKIGSSRALPLATVGLRVNYFSNGNPLMKFIRFRNIPTLLPAAFAFATLMLAISQIQLASAQPPSTVSGDSPAPVEDDMHEFMEYVFQPPYKRLKASIAVAEKDNATWKSIKSDALILAESGNLLLGRGPDGDEADWNKHSIASRDFGGQLYRAAKAKDTEKTMQTYKLMLESCNACHKQFSGGDPELTP
jgi:hypothetical protein